MDISEKNIWQQACGDTDRNYSATCLKWDVILNGPGRSGPYPECVERLEKNNISSKKITDIKRFATEIKEGDIVVLRLGTKIIRGVGLVVGDYEWLQEFSDIDGWDLQHVRRVKWLWKGEAKFKKYFLKQGDTTQKLTSKKCIEWLAALDTNVSEYERELVSLPSSVEAEVGFSEISEYLFDQGVSSNSIELLLAEIGELVRIARWYKKSTNPSEFETITYLVVPLLRALGWTPQKMAIEWNKVDIALFSQLPRENDNLDIVVEAKKKGNSCLSAMSQAQSYAKEKGDCKRLIVTDGLRYGVYIKQDGEFELYAYFNLTELKNDYPIYECFGIKEALSSMTPEWGNKKPKEKR